MLQLEGCSIPETLILMTPIRSLRNEPLHVSAGVRLGSTDTSLNAPMALAAAASAEVASDVYGASLQAGAWLSPKLLPKQQPGLGRIASQAQPVMGTGVHDVCQGAIIITGKLPALQSPPNR